MNGEPSDNAGTPVLAKEETEVECERYAYDLFLTTQAEERGREGVDGIDGERERGEEEGEKEAVVIGDAGDTCACTNRVKRRLLALHPVPAW